MQEGDIKDVNEVDTDDEIADAERSEHPASRIEHYPEPDAENIMPVEDVSGTF